MISKALFELHHTYDKHTYTKVNDRASVCKCGYYLYHDKPAQPVMFYALRLAEIKPKHRAALISHLKNLVKNSSLCLSNYAGGEEMAKAMIERTLLRMQRNDKQKTI